MISQILTEDDFKSLRHNIINVDGPVLSSPEGCGLSRIQSFVDCSRPDKDRVIKYIVLMYSKESPAVTQFKDAKVRSKQCAMASGYNIDTDMGILSKMEGFVVDMDKKPSDWNKKKDGEWEETENKHDLQYVQMVIDYLKSQNELTWTMIVSNEQTFYEYQEALMRLVDEFRGDKDKLSAISVKTKLMEDSDAIAERLERYYKKVFPDTEIQKKGRRVYSPEMMAKKEYV